MHYLSGLILILKIKKIYKLGFFKLEIASLKFIYILYYVNKLKCIR